MVLARLEMPVPFAMRSVNAWLDVADRTLVDCGPRTDGGWAALVSGLAAHGLAPKDVRRVVLTHGHVDHYGNLARLQDANPELQAFVHRTERAWIEDYGATRAERFLAYEDALVRCGLSEPELDVLAAGYHVLSEMGEPARIHGDVPATLELDGARWTTIPVPGHSPGSLAFFEPGSGTLLSGDTLLEKVTTNAVCLAADEEDALFQYRNSLKRLAATKARRVLPGHRAPFGDATESLNDSVRRRAEGTSGAAAVAARHEANIAARGDRVQGLLSEEPRTVRALVAMLFRDVEVDLFLGCSELLGHLRELERAGRATETDDGRWRV